MFKVDDEADETPHLIPGTTNDNGDAMTFAEHLHTKFPSDLDPNDEDEPSSNDDEDEEEAPRPLI